MSSRKPAPASELLRDVDVVLRIEAALRPLDINAKLRVLRAVAVLFGVEDRLERWEPIPRPRSPR